METKLDTEIDASLETALDGYYALVAAGHLTKDARVIAGHHLSAEDYKLFRRMCD